MSSLPQNESLDRREHVSPELTEQRLAASWDRLESRSRPRSRGVWLGGGVAIAAAAAGVVLALSVARSPEAPPWSGTTLVTGGESTSVRLTDGSRIEAEPRTELSLEQDESDETRVSLERGAASFDIERNPSRSFVVEAGDATVRVIGTRFIVRRWPSEHGDRIEVEVERGQVEVEHAGRTRALVAGMSWRTHERVIDAEGVTTSTPDPPAPPTEAEDLEARVPAPEPPSPPGRTAPEREPRPSAGELFERARSARRSGEVAEAARHYTAMVRRFPHDDRAGLAAFELGRLRMDLLRDPAGATEALEQALRLRPSSVFREDAMARLVRAHEAAGHPSRCAGARAAYTAAYPNGRYRNDVGRRCP